MSPHVNVVPSTALVSTDSVWIACDFREMQRKSDEKAVQKAAKKAGKK